jgi:hypothetical protein
MTNSNLFLLVSVSCWAKYLFWSSLCELLGQILVLVSSLLTSEIQSLVGSEAQLALVFTDADLLRQNLRPTLISC